ncbi:MAG: hypothetical protein LBO09_07630 [Candidatus Peribacteria bacterium]|jgi:hypothetical protein|nr:hypothetical protein [Candidatus Peribacteria bacterium]
MENQTSSVPQSQPATAMQIQELLTKQQQLQGQYNQIVARLQANPAQTPEKIQEVKLQLDQLNTLYLQGQQQLQALGYTPVQINKPTVVKEGAKNNFSYKKLAIGCVGFLLLLGGLFALTLVSLVKNPMALAGVGINAATAVNLLSIFAGLIVGVIGLVGVGLLLTNVYRLITVKNQSKIRYILSLIGAVVILGIAGGVAAVVFGQIGKISVEPVVKSTNLIDPYLVGKEGTTRFIAEVPLIAPGEISFVLNQPVRSAYVAKLGEVTPQRLIIDCGNSQKQQLSYGNNGFNANCFYDRKGDYPLKAIVTYDNKITGERGITTEIPLGTLSFTSEIQLFLSAQNAKSSTPLSAMQGEINLGKAPSKISVDAMAVFRSFGLPDYQVVRDMDGDEVNERETPQFDYIYKKAQVYHPTVKFPGLSDFVYSFPVRVEPSDVPICEINFLPNSAPRYRMQTNFLEGSVSTIAGYTYHIIDTSTQKEIGTLKNSTKEVDYTFPEKGNYLVLLDFITVDGKRGGCESEVLQLEKEEITLKYVIKQKLSGMSNFTEVPLSAFSGNTLTFDTIPQAISIDLTAVSPDSASMQKNVFVDGKPLLNQGTLYEFQLAEERTYEVVIRLEDPERLLKREIPLHFVVKKPDIVGKLTFSPDT